MRGRVVQLLALVVRVREHGAVGIQQHRSDGHVVRGEREPRLGERRAHRVHIPGRRMMCHRDATSRR
jgi:hypothetical protein